MMLHVKRNGLRPDAGRSHAQGSRIHLIPHQVEELKWVVEAREENHHRMMEGVYGTQQQKIRLAREIDAEIACAEEEEAGDGDLPHNIWECLWSARRD